MRGSLFARLGRWLARRHSEDAITLGLFVVAIVSFYYLATYRTWSPRVDEPQIYFSGDFFWAQARAIVHGGLSVSPSVITGECFFRFHACYGYFGVTPSLLRLPLLPVMDKMGVSLTPLYSTLALTIAFGSVLATLRMFLPRPMSRRAMVLYALVGLSFGPGGFLVELTRPAVYEEALSWGVAFSCLSVYAFLRWWQERRARWLVTLVVALALGCNARPTVVPLSVVLGVAVLGRTLQQRLRAGRREGPARLAASMLWLVVVVLVVPVGSTLAVFWLKFRALIPSQSLNAFPGGFGDSAYWRQILALNGDHYNGAMFVATNLLAYLRPDTLLYQATFPYFDFRYPLHAPVTLIGVTQGGMEIEPAASITATMALACLVIIVASLVALAALLRRRLHLVAPLFSPTRIALVATLAETVLVLSNVGISNRYLGDFYPFVSLATAVAIGYLVVGLERLRLSAFSAAVVLGGAGVLWGAAVNWALWYQSYLLLKP